jgi:hypothetical protein
MRRETARVAGVLLVFSYLIVPAVPRIMDVLTSQSARQESAPISLSRRENADDPESSAEAMKAQLAGAMKLPRRNFLHLLAGASALPLAPHGERLLRDPTGR